MRKYSDTSETFPRSDYCINPVSQQDISLQKYAIFMLSAQGLAYKPDGLN
jgi:hypothetical protein